MYSKKELVFFIISGFIATQILNNVIEKRRYEKYFNDSLESSMRWANTYMKRQFGFGDSNLNYEKKSLKEES